MTDQRNGFQQQKQKPRSPKKKGSGGGGVFGLMSKRRWFIVVVFLSSVTWSYTAGPPLNQAYISNRYFTNPNRFDYETEALYGNEELIYTIFEPKFWRDTWIWQAGAFFEWIEGPCWINNKLYFSDTKQNRIYSYSDYQGTQIEFENSGDATDKQINELFEPGSNGLLQYPNSNNKIFVAQHASRRIILYNLETGKKEIVASEFEGKKLNSPNDMTIDSNNEYLYFTDPLYGLQTKKDAKDGTVDAYSDKSSDLGFSGIYRVKLNEPNKYKIELIDKSLQRPNGVGISNKNGKERLFVTNSIPNEFNMNVYEIDSKSKNKNVKFVETWNTDTIQSNLSKNKKFLGDYPNLTGFSDGFAIHPSMNYIISTCPEGKICILNELTGKLEAAIKFADGVVVINVLFGEDNMLYITANGNLWQIRLNENNKPF